jgi:hypothetical protein
MMVRTTVFFDPHIETGEGARDGQDAATTKKKVEKFIILAPKHRFFKIQFVTERMKVLDFFQKYKIIKAHFCKKNCVFSV